MSERIQIAAITAAVSLLTAGLTTWATIQTSSSTVKETSSKLENLTAETKRATDAILADSKKAAAEVQNQIAAMTEARKAFDQKLDDITPPSGTIAAFAGPIDSEKRKMMETLGWLVCDGEAVSRKKFALLHGMIGDSWGKGDGVNTFNLPDLRGVFLRGVNGDRRNPLSSAGAFMDPEADDRVSLVEGANAKNKVGSFQSDAFGQHAHRLFRNNRDTGTEKRISIDEAAASMGPTTEAKAYTIQRALGQPDVGITSTNGAPESRPRNAYVYYIIKY